MKYAAFLRGIGPGNPNMRNDKLRGVFEELGFRNVRSVISSGNILFESASGNITAIEAKIEKAWPEKLGFNSTTIIRSQPELKQLVDKKPFGKREHSRESYLLVTFLKQPLKKLPVHLPYESDDKRSKMLSFDKDLQAFFSVTDTTAAKTPDFMNWLEKNFGKEITSRTWNTVVKIANKSGRY